MTGYVYRGNGTDRLEARLARAARRRQGPSIPERIVSALRSLGGEASTTQIRTALELSGAPPFHGAYLGQALARLSRLDPPAVEPAGREEGGRGRPSRWRLGPGVDGGGS